MNEDELKQLEAEEAAAWEQVKTVEVARDETLAKWSALTNKLKIAKLRTEMRKQILAEQAEQQDKAAP